MAITRRRFLFASACGLVATKALVAQPKASPGAPTLAPVRIGLIADAQYADANPKKTRFYRQSKEKLAQAVQHFDRLDLHGCVNLGDLIDHDERNFAEPLKILSGSRHRWYSILGNHDFSIADPAKAGLPARLGMPSCYYRWIQGGFCFLILDTNELSVYSEPKGSPGQVAAEQELARLKAAGAVQAKTWNGAVGPQQLQWIKDQCAQARSEGRKVVVFAHHPIAPAASDIAWNSAALLELVRNEKNIVAWINGHNHLGDYMLHDGVPCVTLPGMVETADTNAFAVAEFFPDRLVLKGEGRVPSRTVPWRQ